MLLVDRVIHVLLIPFDIIPDGSAGSGFYLKYEGLARFVVVVAVDLGTEKQVLVGHRVPVVIFCLCHDQLLLHSLDVLLFVGQEVLAESTQFGEHVVTRSQEALVALN